MDRVFYYNNAFSFIKYNLSTRKQSLKFDFNIQEPRYRNKSNSVLKATKKFSSLNVHSLSSLKNTYIRRNSKKKEKILITDCKELTPPPIRSNLFIDTSPSPKLNFRVRLPCLKKFKELNDSTEHLQNLSKCGSITKIHHNNCLSNQETQTDSSLVNFRMSKHTNKVLLKGKNLIECLDHLPLTPTPEINLGNKQKIKKSKKKLKELINTLA